MRHPRGMAAASQDDEGGIGFETILDADAEVERRVRDLYVLHLVTDVDVVEDDGPGNGEHISDREDVAFNEMLEELQSGRWHALTGAQRAWVTRVAERLGLDTVPPEYRRIVPRGAPVELAPVLRNLPKRPPGRKPV